MILSLVLITIPIQVIIIRTVQILVITTTMLLIVRIPLVTLLTLRINIILLTIVVIIWWQLLMMFIIRIITVYEAWIKWFIYDETMTSVIGFSFHSSSHQRLTSEWNYCNICHSVIVNERLTIMKHVPPNVNSNIALHEQPTLKHDCHCLGWVVGYPCSQSPREER